MSVHFSAGRPNPQAGTLFTGKVDPNDTFRKEQARKYGLPESATYADINQVTSELARQQRARELGLPESAAWGDINRYTSEISRKKRAQELGLPETASWGDIAQAQSRQRTHSQTPDSKNSILLA